MKLRQWIVVVAVFTFCAVPALAQGEWSFTLTPTLWGVGLDGDVSLGNGEDEVRVNYSEGLFGSELAGGLAFEANDGRLGIFAEALFLDASGGAEPPSILTQTADTSLDHQIWSLGATWRVRKTAPEIDAVAGFRYIDADVDIRILSDGAVVKEGAASENWLDFTFGARVRQPFAEKWHAMAQGDFGAGDSELSYQLVLGIGYQFSPKVTANLGYRLIGTDFQVLTKSDTTPPRDLNVYHYSSMKLAGFYATAQFRF